MDKAMGFWIPERHGPSDLDLDGDDGMTALGVCFQLWARIFRPGLIQHMFKLGCWPKQLPLGASQCVNNCGPKESAL
jgi:hypothetical protein